MNSHSNDLSDRYRRQSTIVPEALLRKHPVMVVGVGAIGRQVALQLTVMGVTRLTMIDPDRVEPVNLGAQGFREEDLGKDEEGDERQGLVRARDQRAEKEPDHGSCCSSEQQASEEQQLGARKSDVAMDDPQQSPHLDGVDHREDQDLGEDVRGDLEKDHALALVDAPFGADLPAGVQGSHPEGGDA